MWCRNSCLISSYETILYEPPTVPFDKIANFAFCNGSFKFIASELFIKDLKINDLAIENIFLPFIKQ